MLDIECDRSIVNRIYDNKPASIDLRGPHQASNCIYEQFTTQTSAAEASIQGKPRKQVRGNVSRLPSGLACTQLFAGDTRRSEREVCQNFRIIRPFSPDISPGRISSLRTHRIITKPSIKTFNPTVE